METLSGRNEWFGSHHHSQVEMQAVNVPKDTVVHFERVHNREDSHGSVLEDIHLARKTDRRCRLRMIARKNMKKPSRKRLVAAVKRKIRHDYPPGQMGKWQKYLDEAFIVSMSVFDWLTPTKPFLGVLWVTPILATLALVVFAFMSGAYPFYMAQAGENEEIISPVWSPRDVLGFMLGKFHGGRQFNFNYLLDWGGQYLPNIAHGETHRWFSSLLLHQSSVHLLSNVLIFMVVSSRLELKFGGLPVLLIVFLAGVGSNLLSALMETQCSMVVGAGGIVFGLVGFGLTDLLLDYSSLSIVGRIVAVATNVTLCILAVISKDNGSHISHIGGFICGVVPSLLFHSSLKHELIEAGAVWGSLGFLVVFYSVVPAILIHRVLPSLVC